LSFILEGLDIRTVRPLEDLKYKSVI
jgi:hypothetical protein